MNKLILKILLCLLLLIGCSQNNPELNRDYSQLLQYKKPFLLPESTLEIPFSTPNEKDITLLDSFLEVPNTQLINTRNLLMDDIDDLEWMLKTFYGRYPYYIEEFNKAFEKIRRNVSGSMDRARFTSILVDAFGFDKDYHFTIDGYPMFHTRDNFFDLENVYEKVDNRYINTKTNEEIDTSEFLVPFLEENLQVVYKEKNRINNTNRTIQFAHDFKQLEINISYIHIENFTEHSYEFDQFVSKIKASDVSIIDLRNNQGGLQYYPGYWMNLLTNRSLKYSFNGYLRMNPDIVDVLDNAMFTTQFGAKSRNGYYEFVPTDQVLDRDGLIIVLQNGQTSSAAEILLDYLRHLDNTLFLGTNSSGTLSSNIRSGPYYLKNSGVMINFGNTIFNFNPDYFQEGVGFEPDLYVMDENMQSVINSLVENLTSK